MKTAKWTGLITVMALPLLSGHGQTPAPSAVPGAPAQAQPAVPTNLSPGAAEVVRLASSGVGDEVVLAYIQNSQAPFNLSADDVLYLKDLGLSPQVTSAMLNHDSTLRSQPQQYAPAAPAPATPAQLPPAAVAAPTQPAVTSPVAVAAPTYVSSPPPDVTYFYNDLSPYGTWVYLEGYGWCWQPRTVVISPGWRPYCDGGYWIYTDAGWYWNSTYSWGWAPFHYGRWQMHPRCGWVWFPDRAWGPAWVTWRVAGDNCGWAPLPPHAEFDVRLGWRYNGVTVGASFDFGLGAGAFAFVGFGDFCNHNLAPHCLPPARVTTIYHQTTVINNYVVVNNTVVHRGVPIERVSAASRAPVPRATVRDWTGGSAGMPSRGGAVVYRPRLQAPTRPVNMVAEKVDAAHPVIQHAPITTTRGERPSSFSSGAPAPASSSRRPAIEAPRVSPSPRGATAAPAAQRESAPRTYQPAPTTSYVPTPSRQPEQGKQGTSVKPGYQSETGSPAYNNARSAAPPSSTAARSAAEGRNSHVYYPKGYYQAAELPSASQSEQRQSVSPSSPGKGSDNRSRSKD